MNRPAWLIPKDESRLSYLACCGGAPPPPCCCLACWSRSIQMFSAEPEAYISGSLPRTTSSCLTNSCGVGRSHSLTVFTSACAKQLPITCTASISITESPMEIRFVTASKFSVRCTCKKACTFHAWQSPGNACSYAPRAEMTSICLLTSSSLTAGMQSPAECCTQPSVALVMITTFPDWPARVSRAMLTRSRALSCSFVDAGTPPKCCITSSMCVVAISVSSQSKMVTVCADLGRESCGMNARLAVNFWMYASRKSSVARGRDGACASECAMTSTSSSEYASSEAGAPSANGAAASSSRFVMPTFIK
mmetsp:Transcript_7822/g.20148  ORF Transcript_7822/g.20148 Transcript_7822/m.20148 type:complete len:307 (-) Transcript_7822:24-944(-)